MPRLSILMTARNSERTVESSIRSTLSTMPADAELVVLDDGSTDGTLDVLSRISDRRVVIHSAAHMGVGRGLNHLLQVTDSEFVGRMDADDLCLPGRFGREFRALDRNCDVVFTTVVDWWPDRRRIRVLPPLGVSVRAFPYYLLLTNPVGHMTMLGRRTVLEAAGGYRGVPSEDYDLWLRLASSGARLRRLALPGILYRQHAAQLTASDVWRRESWADEDTGTAFRGLSSMLLGQPFMRLTTLASNEEVSTDEIDDILVAFSARYSEAIAVLPVRERIVLARKCRARLNWVRSVRGLQPAGSLS